MSRYEVIIMVDHVKYYITIFIYLFIILITSIYLVLFS